MLVSFDYWHSDEVATLPAIVDRFQQWPIEILPILNERVYFFIDSCPGHNKLGYNDALQIEMTELQSPDQTKLQPRYCLLERG